MPIAMGYPMIMPATLPGVALTPRHHFTVDVEEYFQVSAFEGSVSRSSWDGIDSRVQLPMLILLDLLATYKARATFFFLGWVASRHPNLVRRVAAAGHEVASHGWGHERVTVQRPEDFRDSIRHTKQLLEDLTGQPVIGFRAPSFSIRGASEWAFDVLLEEGYTYDSSVFPARRMDGNGWEDAQFAPHWIDRPSGRVAEFPPTTLRRFGMTIPAGGGGYFRLLPFALTSAALHDCERLGVPGTLYFHPWEIDPTQPRVRASAFARFRHYTGLKNTLGRLERLLDEFSFQPMRDTRLVS
jgi:polysaccharide deacetylase family protein (PEP-CTERM system associated)